MAYVVTDAKAPRPRSRVEARLLRGDERYDAGFYQHLVLRGLESCVLPFGWPVEVLARTLAGQEQRALGEYAQGAEMAARAGSAGRVPKGNVR